MQLKEISKDEFQALSDLDSTYFQNSVIFDDFDDNVLAFEDFDGETFTYWKVER